MIYLVFSALGLAAVAEEVFVAIQLRGGRCCTQRGYEKVELCFWSLAPASVCMPSHGNCTYKSEIACQCDVVHRFCTKIWPKALSRSKEAVSEYPHESDLYLFLFNLYVFVYKLIRTFYNSCNSTVNWYFKLHLCS